MHQQKIETRQYLFLFEKNTSLLAIYRSSNILHNMNNNTRQIPSLVRLIVQAEWLVDIY